MPEELNQVDLVGELEDLDCDEGCCGAGITDSGLCPECGEHC